MLYVINSFAEKTPWPFNQDSWPGVVAGACNPALRRLIRKAAAAGRHFKKNINEYNPPSKGKIRTNVRFQQNLKSWEQSPGQLPSERQARKVTVWSVRTDPSTRRTHFPLHRLHKRLQCLFSHSTSISKILQVPFPIYQNMKPGPKDFSKLYIFATSM